MRRVPPWRLAEREQWALENPGIAGLYFGVGLSLVVAVPTLIAVDDWGNSETWIGAAGTSAVLAPLSGFLFAHFLKRQGGQRPRAATHPAPSRRRLWSRASDRLLFWVTVAGLAGAAQSIAGLVASTRLQGWAALGLGVNLALVTSVSLERRHRKTDNQA